MKKIGTIIAGITMAIGTAANAQAGETDTYSLQYGSADFESQETVSALYKRVRAVARAHCPNYFTERDLAGVNDCISDVTEDLVRSIDHPALTAFAGSGRTTPVVAAVEGKANKG